MRTGFLIADIVDTLGKFIEADRELMVLMASVVLCSWFPGLLRGRAVCLDCWSAGQRKNKIPSAPFVHVPSGSARW